VVENGEDVPLPPLDWSRFEDMFQQAAPKPKAAAGGGGDKEGKPADNKPKQVSV
jgi:hypothetical protein